MAVLHWIRTIKPWKQYVSHRVNEICHLTKREQWQHCPGDVNPADIPSRGMSGDKLAQNETWWKGPKFLQLPDERWPSTDVFPSSDITESELIKHPAATTRVLVNTTGCVSGQIDKVIDCSRYSSFNKLL